MQILSSDFSIRNTPLPSWCLCPQVDAGWLYILRNNDLLKIGKTKNPKRRLREACTWLPDGELVGVEPFWCIHEFERTLLRTIGTKVNGTIFRTKGGLTSW